MTASELFSRIEQALQFAGEQPHTTARLLHECLQLVCMHGLKDKEMTFGSLFFKIDFLCRQNHIDNREKAALQLLRHQCFHPESVTLQEWKLNCRALTLLVSTLFGENVPATLSHLIPLKHTIPSKSRKIDFSYLRCTVSSVTPDFFTATADNPNGTMEIQVSITDEPFAYLADLLVPGMQLNVLDATHEETHHGTTVLTPKHIVVEPDFLIDISSLAACFTEMGHHPLYYTFNKLRPQSVSQAILLGNFASHSLDNQINHSTAYHWKDTFREHFSKQPLSYCTCRDLNAKENFHIAAQTQSNNIANAIKTLFETKDSPFDRKKVVLEPSFVCEQLGLQGRVDLMTTDFKLLVEQKSGKNFNLRHQIKNHYGGYHLESHYVQLLLYYGVLRRNFHLTTAHTQAMLLYSKYAMPQTLLPTPFYTDLFNEALATRNRIVAMEFAIARNGFQTILPYLHADNMNERNISSQLYTSYMAPEIEQVAQQLHNLPPLHQEYACRMLTFTYREQLASRLGNNQPSGHSEADLWNMPMDEKLETGNILSNLVLKDKQQKGNNACDILTFGFNDNTDGFLPNFREGDSVYLYATNGTLQPDLRNSILYKATITRMETDTVEVHLNEGQQNPTIFVPENHLLRYAIEHAAINSKTSVTSLMTFVRSDNWHRNLLLSQREPQRNTERQLSQSYNPKYDSILLKAKQATDYFLLVGPPGTGKTSMALRYMVQEELCDNHHVLLMAYTNRAVDEICEMLTANGTDYIRIGNEYAADERFRDHILQNRMAEMHTLKEVKSHIKSIPVVVGTTTSILSSINLFQMKAFHVAMIDEASQILEPGIIGLLCCVPKFILIGDHKQLPAVVQQGEQDTIVKSDTLHRMGLYDCRESLFERLLRAERSSKRDHFIGVLQHHGRMHPDIAEWTLSHFYRKEQLRTVPLPHQQETVIHCNGRAADRLDSALCRHRVLFFPAEPTALPQLSDKVNATEAHMVASLMKRIYTLHPTDFDAKKTLGVIVPYRNQIAMIRSEIAKLHIPELLHVDIDTVERYQGSQRDVIIYSFTVQHLYQLDFLAANTLFEDGETIDRKLNVVLTRARKQLLITGNPVLLAHNAVFNNLITHLRQKGQWYVSEKAL